MRARWATVVGRLLAISLPSALLGIAALEGILRLTGYTPHYMNADTFVASPDPDLVFALRPGFRGPYAGVQVTVDAQGRRGRDLAGAGDGATRITFIGDSVTFGQGVADDATLPEQVAARSRAKLGAPVEVVNLGVPGYDTCQERRAFERSLERFRPRAAVLVYVENDTEPSSIVVKDGTIVPADVRSGTYGDLMAFLRKESRAYNLVWSNWQVIKGRGGSLEQYAGRMAERFRDDYPGWRRSRDCLAALGALARRHSVRLLVIPFPPPVGLRVEPYPFAPYVRAVCEAAVAAGAECLDVVPALRDPALVLTVSHVERHPSAAVHARVADEITKRLP